jgi:porphobilinogen synthase
MTRHLVHRPRRLRRTEGLRRMIRETRFGPEQLVAPLFVVPGHGVRREIPSLPHAHHLSVDRAVEEIRALADLGVGGVILFGIPEAKDETGSGAWDPEGPVARTLREARTALPDYPLITDVCLCEYTSHGHCGLLVERKGRKEVANDATLELLAKSALAHAEAGADVVAPSDMMDGRVGAIRELLDHEGHDDVAILAYAAKSASAFYGPFRDAAGSTPSFGDRKSYQMDPANRREALREVRLDVEEGADMVMVKPALTALDIVSDVRRTFDLPVAAYLVSGESAMIDFAAERGVLDGERARMEALVGVFRAGADVVLTYWARHIAAILAGREAAR